MRPLLDLESEAQTWDSVVCRRIYPFYPTRQVLCWGCGSPCPAPCRWGGAARMIVRAGAGMPRAGGRWTFTPPGVDSGHDDLAHVVEHGGPVDLAGAPRRVPHALELVGDDPSWRVGCAQRSQSPRDAPTLP